MIPSSHDQPAQSDIQLIDAFGRRLHYLRLSIIDL